MELPRLSYLADALDREHHPDVTPDKVLEPIIGMTVADLRGIIDAARNWLAGIPRKVEIELGLIDPAPPTDEDATAAAQAAQEAATAAEAAAALVEPPAAT